MTPEQIAAGIVKLRRVTEELRAAMPAGKEQLTRITPALAGQLVKEHHAASPPERFTDEQLIAGYAEDMCNGDWSDLTRISRST
jgi:hypothetical protein